jgi:hypothetical protein
LEHALHAGAYITRALNRVLVPERDGGLEAVPDRGLSLREENAARALTMRVSAATI